MQDLNSKVENGGATADGLLTATEFNQIPSELQNLITSAGGVLSGADLLQAVKAISTYSGVGDFYVGAGVANAYTASVGASRIAPIELVDGLKIRFKASANNTGASTCNAFGSGVIDIKKSGGISGVSAGEITTENETILIFRSLPSNHWELSGVSAASQPETNAGTNDTRFITPLKLRFGFLILLQENGYVVFPEWLGSLVFQWASFNHTAGEAVVQDFNFPIVFPNNVFSYAALDRSSLLSRPTVWAVQRTPTLASIALHWAFGHLTSNDINRSVRVIAIGN